MNFQSRLAAPRRRMTAAAATALVALSLPLFAQASPAVSLTAFENLSSTTPGMGPGVDVMDSNANGGDYFRSASSTLPDPAGSTFFHTYGFTTGLNYFGARASGNGTFWAKTSATYTDSYTNTSGVDQLVSFNFFVDEGNAAVSGTGTGYADLALNVLFNGGSVASSRARVDTLNGCVDTGSGALAGYLGCDSPASASGAAGAYLVSQVLGAGGTLNINYSIVSEVAGLMSAGSGELCSHGGFAEIAVARAVGEGEETPVVEEGGDVPNYNGCVDFFALSRSGDPANLNGFQPAAFSITAANLAVPEPGSLALTGLALALVALPRLRRRGTAQAV